MTKVTEIFDPSASITRRGVDQNFPSCNPSLACLFVLKVLSSVAPNLRVTASSPQFVLCGLRLVGQRRASYRHFGCRMSSAECFRYVPLLEQRFEQCNPQSVPIPPYLLARFLVQLHYCIHVDSHLADIIPLLQIPNHPRGPLWYSC